MLKNIFLALLAVILGVAIAVYRIAKFDDQAVTLKNGVWKADKEMDLGNNKLLTARIAVAALFALKKSEVIYMVADKDNEGQPLSSENDYVVSGVPINSRYWSVTLYASDYFLVPNKPNRFSFNKMNLQFESDNSFVMNISANEKELNWLPSGSKGRFYLLLRMYHPDTQVHQNLQSVKLPDIKRIKKI